MLLFLHDHSHGERFEEGLREVQADRDAIAQLATLWLSDVTNVAVNS